MRKRNKRLIKAGSFGKILGLRQHRLSRSIAPVISLPYRSVVEGDVVLPNP